jgi:hypothetical protein
MVVSINLPTLPFLKGKLGRRPVGSKVEVEVVILPTTLLAHPAPNTVLSLATDASDTHVGDGLQQLCGGGQPATPSSTFSAVRHFRFQSPYFVSLFEGAQESIPSLAGRINSLESIPGLLKCLQIRTLLEGRHFRLLTDQSPNW